VLSHSLAEFAVNQTVPEPVLHVARRSLLNACAAAVGAADSEPVEILAAWSRQTFASGASQVWFRAERFSPAGSAAINGTMIHELDYDDTHAATLVHPTAPVLPAVISLGEVRQASGRALLEAFALGGEISLRLGAAVFPAHYDRGFHVTATAGAIGAAGAAARILQLDATHAEQALGIAASRSGGLRQTFGSHSKSAQVGHAASVGAAAGQLASDGLNSGTGVLEGPFGWAHAFGGGFDPDALNGLGGDWLFSDNSFKAFACGNVGQAVIDGVIRLREGKSLDPNAVEALQLTVSPRAVALCGNPRPTTGLQGKFSLAHAASVALVDGRAGEAQFTDARVADPLLEVLRSRVTVAVDTGLTDLQAVVGIRTRDGQSHQIRVDDCLGSLQRPLSDAQLEDKFSAMADGRLSARRQRALIDSIWHLESVPDVRDWAFRQLRLQEED
jgi:2-methylcitrate dehydratase PrpD